MHITDVVAVDIETTALRPDNGEIRLVTMADATGTLASDSPAAFADILRNPAVCKAMHNACFDATWLRQAETEISNVQDTMILSQLLGNAHHGNSLEALAKRYLGVNLPKDLQHADNWQGNLTEAHIRYAKADAWATLELYWVLWEKIREAKLSEVAAREMRTINPVVRMSRDGLPFDLEAWRNDEACLQDETEAIQASIRRQFGMTVNLRSPAQLKDALSAIGINVRNTEERELARLRYEHPVLEEILRFKKLKKLLSTFGSERLATRIGPDGRLRGDWRILGAITGRMTCSNPNLQGLPGVAKQRVTAPPGRLIVTADYSQIELRVLAQLSEDEAMIESFRRGEDLHRKTAARIFSKSEAEVSSAERRIAKATNFGLVYGMTSLGLHSRTRALDPGVTLADAEHFRDTFFGLYPGVRRFQHRMLQSSTVRSLGGRWWFSENLKPIQRFNYPVQASAADGFKEALCLVHQHMPEDWKLIAAVHDEIVLEVPENQARKAECLLGQCMQRGMAHFITQVPIVVDSHASQCWSK